VLAVSRGCFIAAAIATLARRLDRWAVSRSTLTPVESAATTAGDRLDAAGAVDCEEAFPATSAVHFMDG
jgi:hypothetical protein